MFLKNIKMKKTPESKADSAGLSWEEENPVSTTEAHFVVSPFYQPTSASSPNKATAVCFVRRH